MTLLLGALIAVAPLAMDIYLASMPSMTRALSATPGEVQLTLSLYMYGWGATQIFVGPLADRFGRRPALIAGLALFVAASAVCAASRTIETLIAARVAQAIGMATVAVVPRAVVRDLYTGERAARMLSLMGVVLGVAPIVAPIIGSHLHVWFGWQANFVFVAAYGAIALVCVVIALPETIKAKNARATHPTVVLANYRRLLQSRRHVGYALVAAFASSGLFAFLAGSAFAFVTMIGTGERFTSSMTDFRRFSNSPFTPAPACRRPRSRVWSCTLRSGSGTLRSTDSALTSASFRRDRKLSDMPIGVFGFLVRPRITP